MLSIVLRNRHRVGDRQVSGKRRKKKEGERKAAGGEEESWKRTLTESNPTHSTTLLQAGPAGRKRKLLPQLQTTAPP